MSYDDFYEPSEFDEKVEEFKDYLRKSVKEETQELIEKLQKENNELRGVRDNWNKVKRGYEEKQRELQREIEACKANAARMRLDELFEATGMNVILWIPRIKAVCKPKCGKCDKARLIHFKSPSGKDCTENCQCAKIFYKYSPKPYYLSEFRINHRTGKGELPLLMWFKKYSDYSSDYDGYTYDSSNLCKFVYDGEDFEALSEKKGDIYFREEEKCREYCEYLNKMNGITDDMTEKD